MSDHVKDIAMPPTQNARLMRSATYAAVGVAFVLIAVKFFAWQLTGSLSLFATLIDSLLDAAASLINLLAVRHALSPADREHRFGHGKAEPLAALGQSAFIAGSAAFLVIEAIPRFITPQAVTHSGVGIGVMVFAIAATLGLAAFQTYVIKRTSSVAITADALHYKGDILVNAAVIVSLLLSAQLGWHWADPLFGVGIAAYIVYNAWLIAKSALNMLMDRELPDELREQIQEMVLNHDQVLGIHDLRTRASGPQKFIQCHIEMDGSISLHDAHEVADQVERQLGDAFPGAEVIIHQDPYLGDASGSPDKSAT